jgi:hypothetical protein
MNPFKEADNESALFVCVVSRTFAAWLPLELGFNKIAGSPLLPKLVLQVTLLLKEEFNLNDPEDLKNF